MGTLYLHAGVSADVEISLHRLLSFLGRERCILSYNVGPIKNDKSAFRRISVHHQVRGLGFATDRRTLLVSNNKILFKNELFQDVNENIITESYKHINIMKLQNEIKRQVIQSDMLLTF